MKQISLTATPRDVTGSAVVKLRRDGQLPAVVYGPQHATTHITVEQSAFEKVYKEAGTSGLVDLTVEGAKPVKVLVHEIQREPVSGMLQHVDFYQVDMSQKTTANVELRFVGEAKAVKELGGVLLKNLKTVTIECLPEHLVQYIDVDISSLNTFDDIIRVQDVSVPDGVNITDQPSVVVAGVQKPRTEAELKALEEQPATEEIGEVEKVGDKEKTESDDEEGVDGETPADEEKKEKK